MYINLLWVILFIGICGSLIYFLINLVQTAYWFVYDEVELFNDEIEAVQKRYKEGFFRDPFNFRDYDSQGIVKHTWRNNTYGGMFVVLLNTLIFVGTSIFLALVWPVAIPLSISAIVLFYTRSYIRKQKKLSKENVEKEIKEMERQLNELRKVQEENEIP